MTSMLITAAWLLLFIESPFAIRWILYYILCKSGNLFIYKPSLHVEYSIFSLVVSNVGCFSVFVFGFIDILTFTILAYSFAAASILYLFYGLRCEYRSISRSE